MFDKNLYFSKLKTKNLGNNLLYFEKISSTNEYALNTELPPGSLVIADIQTKGRGRNTRQWDSSNNKNLYFSCVIDKIEPAKLLQLNIVIGYAVVNILRNYIDCYLKWPNDIFAENKKLGGILIETKFIGNKLEKIIFGIGLNVNNEHFDQSIEHIATSLKKIIKKEICKELLLAEIINELETNIKQLNDNYNIATLWSNYSYFLNKKIAITVDGSKEIFTEKGIDEYGGLIVEDKFGIRKTLYSGDIGYDFCN